MDDPTPSESPHPSEAAVRQEVRTWLRGHWDRGRKPSEWLAMVVDARWAAPSWPPEWFGRGWPPELSQAVREEFIAAGAPGAGQDRTNLWANTLLAFASDDMKERF